MNIEEKLKEIGDYFKQKVLEGDYKFIKCGEHTATILVNGVYVFELWIGNNPRDNFNFYNTYGKDLIYSYLCLTTQKERIKCWSKLKPHINSYKSTILKREKQREINRLQKEIANLESKI